MQYINLLSSLNICCDFFLEFLIWGSFGFRVQCTPGYQGIIYQGCQCTLYTLQRTVYIVYSYILSSTMYSYYNVYVYSLKGILIRNRCINYIRLYVRGTINPMQHKNCPYMKKDNEILYIRRLSFVGSLKQEYVVCRRKIDHAQ